MGTNKRVLPGKLSQSYSILELIAVSGELPADQLKRLSGGGRYKEKLVKELKHKKLIHTFYKDKLRTYRLTAKAKEMLLTDDYDKFAFCLTGNAETNLLKSEIDRRLRLRRITETTVTMLNAGASIYKDSKPDVFCAEDTYKSPMQSITSAAFYSSREIRGMGTEFVKVSGTRSVGTLLTETDIYVVYNTGSSLMKWKNNSELKTKTVMRVILGIERLPHQYFKKSIRAILLGDNMEIAYQILANSERPRKGSFFIDGSFDNFLFITNDYEGEVVLKIICNPEIAAGLHSLLSKGMDKCNHGLYVENDAIDENGNPVLFAYDFDMCRIIRFNHGIQMRGSTGTIYCFDFQADILRRYCCENIQFQIISLEKFEAMFFPQE